MVTKWKMWITLSCLYSKVKRYCRRLYSEKRAKTEEQGVCNCDCVVYSVSSYQSWLLILLVDLKKKQQKKKKVHKTEYTNSLPYPYHNLSLYVNNFVFIWFAVLRLWNIVYFYFFCACGYNFHSILPLLREKKNILHKT